MKHLHGTQTPTTDSQTDTLEQWAIEKFRNEAAMSLEETEINVGGVSFKGVYIAVFLTALGTVSGGIWAASEFYSRVGSIEETLETIPDVSPIVERLSVLENRVNAISIPDIAPVTERVSVLEDRLNSMTIPDITTLETNMASSMEAINTIKVDIAGIQIPDLTDIETDIATIETQLADNNIGQLQGQLAELSTSLANMMEQVRTLTELRDDVAAAQQEVTEGSAEISKMQVNVNSALRFADDVKRLQTEVEDLWNGMDALANPLN